MILAANGIRRIEKGPKLVDSVIEQMRRMIDESVWKEGDKIASENQLAADFNVSRIVVREALQNLRAMNLIVTRQGLGSFVCNPNNFANNFEEINKLEISEDDFQSLSELRLCVEKRAAFLSVKLATDDDLREVRNALQSMQDNIGDLDKFTSADFMFHMSIVEAGHSKFLSKVYQGCRNEIYFALREMNRVPESHTFAITSHTRIYSALVARDYNETSKIYKDTFEFNRARYKKLFRN